MDVQALGSAVIVAPPSDQAQSQNLPNNLSPDPSANAGGVMLAVDSTSSPQPNAPTTDKLAATKPAALVVHAPASASPSTAIHVGYRYVQNPVQVVVVFTDAADGQQIEQVPPEFMVKLVQFDHDKGQLVDRDA